MIQVGSLEEAEAAAAAGVDTVIAQGVEAGGHVRGTTSIWELLRQTVERLAPVPVLASGGIGDGAGVARALELGAQGVSLGTRFVASDEAWIHPAYKQRVVEATAADTVYSELYALGGRTRRTGRFATRPSRSGTRPGARRRASGRARERRSGHGAPGPASWSNGRATRSESHRPSSTATSSMRRCGAASRAAS